MSCSKDDTNFQNSALHNIKVKDILQQAGGISEMNVNETRAQRKRTSSEMTASSNATSLSFEKHFDSAKKTKIIPEDDISDQMPGASQNETILFDHKAEMLFWNDKQMREWKKGRLMVEAKSNNPLIVRLKMKAGIINLNEKLNPQMKFELVSKTTIKIEYFQEDEMPTGDSTIRFKTSKICEEFNQVLLTAKDQLKTQIEKSCKYVQRSYVGHLFTSTSTILIRFMN